MFAVFYCTIVYPQLANAVFIITCVFFMYGNNCMILCALDPEEYISNAN